ncbi:CPBP family intramembrane glutamic endopeptidase [Pedobacter sandarakinus]|uniref:CPBP family intramembrane glutamic endopeptidase n=1 Tax=Pedobacter sandarakinus TaxID=353156 RepID=UPI002247A78C|nr:CPBP family intramembrane glutamic endopeptidase [Pedobacter sandarakinus]MCX2573928.1 CPBP family intramembrane metalloprotease [Pedobacter sandarakinus]
MKYIIYFLLVWILIGALIGSFGFGLISLIDKITFREAINVYDKKVSYILIFQFVSLISTVITMLIFLKREQLNILDIGLKLEYHKSILQGFIFGALPVILVLLILYFSGKIDMSSAQFTPLNFSSYFFIFIVGSLNEELLTRGYVLRYLMLNKNKYSALILSSILFAVFHVANDNLSIIPFLNIFLSGLFLGIFYIYFKNLWFSISAHFAWNFFQGPILGSPVSGLKTESIFKQTLNGPDYITGGKFGFEASIICTLLLLVFIYLLYLFCESRAKGIAHKNSNLKIVIG